MKKRQIPDNETTLSGRIFILFVEMMFIIQVVELNFHY